MRPEKGARASGIENCRADNRPPPLASQAQTQVTVARERRPGDFSDQVAADTGFQTLDSSGVKPGSVDRSIRGPFLWEEMQAAVRLSRDYGGHRVLAELLGITREAIQRAGGLGLLRITTEGRYFEPAKHGGDLVAVVPAFELDIANSEPELVDLIAFRTSDPTQTWIRTGWARALGGWNGDLVRDATPIWRLPDDPPLPALKIYRTPLSWLRAACDGVCVLNPAWTEHVLAEIGRIQPEDVDHAHEVFRELRERPGSLPKIVVPRRAS